MSTAPRTGPGSGTWPRFTAKPSASPIISALRNIARATARRGVGEPASVGAGELHRRDPEQVAERRVDRDDGEVRRQRVGAIGALHDRQPEQHRVREERAEADRHRLAGAAAEKAPGAEDAEDEGDDRADVERDEQPRVEHGPEVEVDKAAEQQAGHGEALGEDHQAVDGGGEKTPARVAA